MEQQWYQFVAYHLCYCTYLWVNIF